MIIQVSIYERGRSFLRSNILVYIHFSHTFFEVLLQESFKCL